MGACARVPFFILEKRYGILDTGCYLGGRVANLYRLVFLLLLSASGLACAQGSVPPNYRPPICGLGPNSGSYCNQVLPTGWSCTVTSWTTEDGGCASGRIWTPAGSSSTRQFYEGGVLTPAELTCPINGIEITPKPNVTCACKDGFKSFTNPPGASNQYDCKPTFTCPDAGTALGNKVVQTTAASPLGKQTVCSPASGSGGCLYDVVPTTAYPSQVPGSKDWYASGPAVAKSGTCTFDPAAPPSGTGTEADPKTGAGSSSDVDPTCSPPKQKGQFNGVDVCLSPKPGDPVVSKKETTTKPPTSAASAATAPATTTTNTTTCAAGSCTTTTTTSTTVGGVKGPETVSETKESQDDFCTKNPKVTQCLVGSFSGSCASGFTCEGDAVQCAIARETHARNCQTLQPDTDTNSIFNKAVAGQDPADLTAAKTAAAANAVSVGTFNQDGFSWPRACPADPVITLSWYSAESLTLPFSRLCGPFGLMADAAVAITALGCLLFVLRGSGS